MCRLWADRDEMIYHGISECSKLVKKVYETPMGGESDPLGIVQKIEIWLYEQVVIAQHGICHREWDSQTSLRFWDTKGSLDLVQTTRPGDSQQNKENLSNSGLYDPGRRWSKIKRWKEDKYLELARDQMKLWNMKVMVIPIVVGALGTIPKELVKAWSLFVLWFLSLQGLRN